MKIRHLLLAIAVAGFALPFPIAAQDNKCSLKNISLSCGPSKATRADLFRAFSNPETTQDLQALVDKVPLFENGKQQEAYRRSMERIWRAVTRHGREERRRYRRGRLTDEAYLKVEADFAQARLSYDAAINLYRHHIWMQKDRSKPSG